MPTMKFTNEEIGTLLQALRTETGEWLRYKTFHGSAQNINSVSTILKNTQALEARVQEVYDNMTDEDDQESIGTQITEAEAKRRTAVAKMIISEIQVGEALHDGSIGPYLGGYPGEGMVWHHKHGWLHPKKYMEAAKADVEAGDLTREEVAYALGFDIAEVDAQIASIRDRLDRLEPGTWTALPDEVDSDDLMFDVTDPEDKIVIASADTQTDGTMVGFHAFPTEADNIVSKGIWALITRNFSLASDRDIKLAEKALKADPARLDAIKTGVEDLQKALAQDGNVKIDINVSGKTTTIEADHETAARLLRDLDLAQRSF